MSNINDPEWADNPRLDHWLRTRAAALPEWAEQTAGQWDFSTGSLEGLEREIRRRYTSWDEAQAAGDNAFMAVSAWYVGEVHVRTYGAVWRCAPQPGSGAYARTVPVVTLPREVLEDWELEERQENEELYEELYEDDFPYCAPSEVVDQQDQTADHRLEVRPGLSGSLPHPAAAGGAAATTAMPARTRRGWSHGS
ncbi:hypothetical protein [Kitasatospora camelliae]|uniref:Uncharacterized protein n=1 Tax=Kitasatospora camelliae TaxID=3156397 RepID=A0AAU8JNQ7_9ACTN